MDDTTFDRVAKRLSARRTRRSAVAGGIGLAAAGVLSRQPHGLAQETTPTMGGESSSDPHPSADTAAETEYLFVQPFASGTWGPKDGEDGVFTLILSGAPAYTVYFSDRPERIFGVSPTKEFLDNLGFTPANPPNAALVAQAGEGADQDVIVVELLNPVLDESAGTLTYDARILADYAGSGLAHAARQQSDFEVPPAFGDGALFIDEPFCPAIAGQCYKEVNGAPVIVGSLDIDMCFALDRVPWCEPCAGDGRAAVYGKACAQRHPDQCSYGPLYDANGQLTGTQYDCFGRGVGI